MTDATESGKQAMLVVDDSPEVRKIIGEVLRIFGWPCEEAADGVEALNLIQKQRFDIVLCDIRMPGMNGLEVMAEARKIWADMPFIMITGYDRDYSYDQVMEAGAQDFITKPFTHGELKAKLGRILKERRLAQGNMRLWQEEVRLNKKLSTVLSVGRDLSKADSGTHFDPEVVAAFLRCLPRGLGRYRGNHFSHAYADEMLMAIGATPCDETDRCRP